MDIRHLLALSLLFSATAAQAAPPVANTDTRTIPAGVAVTINVLSNDSDPDGDGISVLPDSIIAPENVTITVNSDGGIQVIPAAGVGAQEPEVIFFSYTIQDDSELAETSEGSVEITVVPNAISGNAENNNAVSVAQALDSICYELSQSDTSDAGQGTQNLNARCNELLELAQSDPDAAAAAIQQISPEETLSLKRLGTSASKLQADVVGARLTQLGQGISAASRNRLSWSTLPLGAAAGDGDTLLAKFGVFGTVQLEDAEKDRTAAEAGFDYSSTALTLGADYAFSNDWFMGAAFGWTNNDLDYTNNDGEVTADIFTFIGYSTYNFNNLSVDIQLGYSGSEIDISRHIHYTKANPDQVYSAHTQGETSGDELFFSAQTQYLWSMKALTLYPRARLNFSTSEIKGYADNEDGGWAVVLGDQSIDRWVFEAGMQSTYAITTGWGVFIPHLDLNLIADLNTDQELMTGSFAYAPENSQSFALEAEDPDSMYYQIGVGFSAVLPGGSSAFAGVRQTLGYDDYKAMQVQAGFRMEF